jgi:protoheme IX farnesyltransferase
VVLREKDEAHEPAAKRLFGISLIYLFALFAALIGERLAHVAAFGSWM